jgi:hypothetical protein
VTTRIAPSVALEAAIEELLAEGLGDGERLAEIGRAGGAWCCSERYPETPVIPTMVGRQVQCAGERSG